MIPINERNRERDLLTQLVSIDKTKLGAADDEQLESFSLLFKKVKRTPDMIMYMLMRECALKFDLVGDFYKQTDQEAIAALESPWEGNSFVVPKIVTKNPLLKIERWLQKCIDECTNNRRTVTIIIPNYTDAAWFHNLVLPNAKIMFIQGRLIFPGHKVSSPTGSIVALYAPETMAALESLDPAPSFAPDMGTTKFAVYSSITGDEANIMMQE